MPVFKVQKWQKSALGSMHNAQFSSSAGKNEKPWVPQKNAAPTEGFMNDLYYQMTTLLEGARYIPSDFLTLKVAYHSGKFLGGILARR